MRCGLLAVLFLPLAIAAGCGNAPSGALPPQPDPGTDLCSDGVLDGQETDVDCGGPGCNPCPLPDRCVLDRDCVSGICEAGSCYQPTCADGRKDFDESDVDCGGFDPGCPRCPDLGACLAPSDCSSGICQAWVCTPSTCHDGLRDGGEEDVDCGGPCPGSCLQSQCYDGSDCQSGVCIDHRWCGPPACDDGVRNRDESDVDCGGTCPPCKVGESCKDGNDCDSGACAGGTCRHPSCDDGVQNGYETGTDCGGSACPPCSP